MIEQVLQWAGRTFGERICIASSMTDAVVIDLVSKIIPGIDVIFIDTGYHFPETIGTRDAVTAHYPVNVVTVSAHRGVSEDRCGTDLCCLVRKVLPLNRALINYDAWITGIRREETTARRDARMIEWDDAHGKLKINPIVDWTREQVDAYVKEHRVIVNPLVHEGYGSIGCAPVTVPGDARDGRWPGQERSECGLHLQGAAR